MKTWFITGSSSGIGRGIARAVLEKGDNAVVMARDIRKLDEMVQQYPDTALAVPLELTDKSSIRAAAKTAKERFGDIDVLVNNAGHGYRAAMEDRRMERPYTICHILSALDGKITGPFMGTKAAQEVSGEYARIRTEYHADAWLYGTVTTKEFTNGRKPDLDSAADVPEGDFIAVDHAPLYYVSIDTRGEIGWESCTFRKAGRPDAHVIEVLTEQTSAAYRAYLRKHKVSYILAGSETLDCRIAVKKLYQLFGIDTMLICGGGTVNWTFLQQGVVDELSLMLAPAADGTPDTVSVFEKSSLLSASAPVEFQMKKVETLKNDGARLIYSIKGNS